MLRSLFQVGIVLACAGAIVSSYIPVHSGYSTHVIHDHHYGGHHEEADLHGDGGHYGGHYGGGHAIAVSHGGHEDSHGHDYHVCLNNLNYKI